MGRFYKIGELTELLGITPRTVRYYDQMGLVGNSHSRAADIMVSSGLSVTQGNAVLLRTINNAARVAVSSEI